MTHEEFVRTYREGRLRVSVDRTAAARLVSARLLLPFVLLPVLGLAVALALTGYLAAGILVFMAVLGVRFLVRTTSQGFVLSRALQDRAFYDEMIAKGILSIDTKG
jgi:predicted membrane-bound spermidine synthase